MSESEFQAKQDRINQLQRRVTLETRLRIMDQVIHLLEDAIHESMGLKAAPKPRPQKASTKPTKMLKMNLKKVV